MSSSLVRAGGAFIEMLIKDEQVQEALDRSKEKLKAWGASIDAMAKQSNNALGTTSSSAIPATGAAVGVLATSMAALKATAIAVGTAFRVGFGMITTSVLRATVIIGALAATVSKFASGGKFQSFLNSFLSKSSLTEASGRWTKFIGLISGSSVLRDIGIQIERLGLASSIVAGFQKGIGSGILAAGGAALRSARSVITGGLVKLAALPIRAIVNVGSSVFSTVTGIGGGGQAAALQQTAAAAAGANRSLIQAVANGQKFGSLAEVFGLVGRSISSISTKVIGLAAAISGPALLAGANLVKNYEKMAEEGLISQETAQRAEKASEAAGEAADAISVAWAQVGIAALPVLQGMAEKAAHLADMLGSFVQENADLAAQIVATAAKIGGMAAGVLALGKAFSAVAAVAPIILNPITLTAAGIAGLVYLVPSLRDAFVSMFSRVADGFSGITPVVNQMVDAISAAISGGSIMAAWNVLWTGIKVVWTDGTTSLQSMWIGFTTSLSSFGIKSFIWLRNAWTEMLRFFSDGWAVFVNWMSGLFRKGSNFFAEQIAVMIAMMTGQNSEEVLATLHEDQKRAEKASNDGFLEDMAKREEAAKKQSEESKKFDDEWLKQNDQVGAEKRKQAQDAAKAAREEFERAKEEAFNIQTERRKFEGQGKLKNTETIGTFSGFNLAQQRIGGIGGILRPLENIDAGVQQVAANTGKNPFEFVA